MHVLVLTRHASLSTYRIQELYEKYMCYCEKNTGVLGDSITELTEKVPSLTAPDVDAVPGFSFADCDRLKGDQEDQVVSWKGRTDITAVGEAVGIRIRMFGAKLFAYRV